MLFLAILFITHGPLTRRKPRKEVLRVQLLVDYQSSYPTYSALCVVCIYLSVLVIQLSESIYYYSREKQMHVMFDCKSSLIGIEN